MKSKRQLAVVAANVSEDVRSVHCRFPGSSQTYTFKCPAGLAEDLAKDDYVVAQTSKQPYAVVKVVRVDDICDLEEAEFDYHWIVQKVDVERHEELKTWEAGVVEQLHSAQRRRAQQAMFAELGLDTVEVPRIGEKKTSTVMVEGKIVDLAVDAEAGAS